MTMTSLPPSPSRERVDACVERLCQKGCRVVWEVIATMERGENLPETAHLAPTEHTAVLTELKSIMAVYGGSCSLK